MREEIFQAQITRLRETYGSKNYPIERAKILWNAFRNEQDDTFTQAVTLCIAQKRSSPMFQELSECLLEARKAIFAARYQPVPGLNLGLMLQYAASANKMADKDFVQACLFHLKHFLNKEITKEQFVDGCTEIDKLAKQLRGFSV